MTGMTSKFAAGLALVAAGAATRLLVRDIPNFAPIAALALFAGYLFADRRLALWVPLGAMVASDWVIGGYDWRLMAVVYASLAMPAFWGPSLRRWLPIARGGSASGGSASGGSASGGSASGGSASGGGASGGGAWGSVATLVGCSLAGSLLFFATTNLAVWALGSMYEHSWAGLAHCYVRALPFFRYTLAGDLVFSTVLFSGLAAVQLFFLRSRDKAVSEPLVRT